MMYRLLLMLALVPLAEYVGPWWCGLVVVAAVVLAVGRDDPYPFLTGFYGGALPWMAAALYYDVPNHHALSDRMAQLFSLPDVPYLLVVMTGLLGGLLGGWTAYNMHWIAKQIGKRNGTRQ